MMFDKNNTNFNGECLCESCKYLSEYKLLVSDGIRHVCSIDDKAYHSVGVCNEYVEFKKDI